MDKNEQQETIQNFSDMVSATEKLTKPWRVALIVTNLFWALVFAFFIGLAYLTPDTSYQMQDFTGQTQTQSVGDTVTNGVE